MKWRLAIIIIATVLTAFGLNMVRYRSIGTVGLTIGQGSMERTAMPAYCIAAGDTIGFDVRGVPFTNLIDVDECKSGDTSYPVSYVLNSLVAVVFWGLIATTYILVKRNKEKK